MVVVMLLFSMTASFGGQARRQVIFIHGSSVPTPGSPQAHIAKALGYFQDEGLDVTIVHARGSVDAFNFLALKRGDFAFGYPDGFVRSVQEGASIRSVCTVSYRYAIELVVLNTSLVKSVRDLQGKKIGVIGPGSSGIPYVKLRFAEVGVPFSDSQFAFVGSDLPAFLALTRKEVDALATTESTTALFEIERVPLRRLESPISKRLEGLVIAARDDLIGSEPTMVEAFLRAFAKAQHYYLSNPRAGIIAMSKLVPEVGKDLRRSLVQGAAQRAKAVPPSEAGGLYCWTSPGRWEALQEVLLIGGYLKRKQDPTTYFTPQFLLGANSFDRVKVRQQAQAVK